MVAEMDAKEYPMHAYTKEIVFAKIFGLTGIKINLSLIADVDKTVGDNFIGLTKTKDGYDYLWGDYARHIDTNRASYIQSIGYKDAVALQLDPRYSSQIGTIAVGISYGHIVKAMNDPNIRMVIPYHKSGMNAEFAMIMNIDKYTDYTAYQNTTIEGFYDENGNRLSINTTGDDSSVGSAVSKKYSDYQFNNAMLSMNPKEAAQDYIRWCGELHPTNKAGVYT